MWAVFPRKSLFKKADQRQAQLEADVHRLFLVTSYNHFIRNAREKDADEICNLAARMTFDDQQKQVQENVHGQIQDICRVMDDILVAQKEKPIKLDSTPVKESTHRSGLSFAVGRSRTYPDTTEQLLLQLGPSKVWNCLML